MKVKATFLFWLIITVYSSSYGQSFEAIHDVPQLGYAASEWADFNNNGLLDIIVIGENDAGNGETHILRNEGDKSFTSVSNSIAEGWQNPQIKIQDYNRSGRADVLVYGQLDGSWEVKLYENQGNFSFQEVSLGITAPANGGILFEDFDNDGLPDILVYGSTGSSGTTEIYRNTGSGFSEIDNINLPGIRDGSVIALDFNNNGRKDLFLTGRSNAGSNFSRLSRNDGEFNFSSTNIFFLSFTNPRVWSADFSNNGYQDILLIGTAVSGFQASNMYINNGNGSFTSVSSTGIDGVLDPEIAIADITGNSHPDLIAMGRLQINNNRSTRFYTGNGNGTFSNQSNLSPQMSNGSVALGDFTNNQIPDIMMWGDASSGARGVLFETSDVSPETIHSPDDLSTTVNPNSVRLSWGFSDSGVNSNRYSYDIYLGTSSGGRDVFSPLSSISSGHSLVASQGHSKARQLTIPDLPDGEYYWSVQAVDPAGNRSVFASEQSFTVGPIAEVDVRFDAAGTTISSVANAQAEAAFAMGFTLDDEGGDVSDVLLESLTIRKGADDDFADWTDIIAGAALIDSDGRSDYTEVTILSDRIEFSGFDQATNRTGGIQDGESKGYELYIWLKDELDDNLNETLDGRNFVFEITPDADITTSDGSSEIRTSTAISTSGNDNEVVVTATDLAVTTQPGTEANAYFGLDGAAATVQAVDANGNWSLRFTSTDFVVSNTAGIAQRNTPDHNALSDGSLTTTDLGFFSSGTTRIVFTDVPTGITTETNEITITPTIGLTSPSGGLNSGVLQGGAKDQALIGIGFQYFGSFSLKGFSFVINEDPAGKIENIRLVSSGTASSYSAGNHAANVVAENPVYSGGMLQFSDINFNLGGGSNVQNHHFFVIADAPASVHEDHTNPLVISFDIGGPEFTNNASVINGINLGPTFNSGDKTYTFEGPPLPGQVVLTAPADEAERISLTPEVSWESASNTVSYKLIVADNPAFTSPAVEEAGITATSFEIADNLDHGQLYYWQVRAENSSGTGDWSDARSFTTIQAVPDAVTLLSPDDEAENITLQPTFAWETISGADTYELMVSANSDFSDSVIDENGLTDTDYTIGEDLSRAQNYFWRVRGINSGGEGDWSEVFRFTTIPDVPDVATLLSPDDGEVNIILQPTLAWEASDGAESYQLMVSVNSDVSDPIIVETGLSETSYSISEDLSYNHPYFWRVRGINSGGEGDWSEVYRFTTVEEVPEEVGLVSPSHESINIRVRPELRWEAVAGAAGYELVVSQYEDFSDLLIHQQDLADELYTVSEDLDYSGTYYWRVRALSSGGSGPWSEAGRFTTLAAPPDILFPHSEADQISIAPRLRWQQPDEESASGIHYRVQLFEEEMSGEAVRDMLVSDSMVDMDGLSGETRYFWRVRVEHEDVLGGWSEATGFTTRTLPDQNVPISARFGGVENDEGPADSQDYRMIGLPGNEPMNLQEVFGGDYGTSWKAFYDDGSDSDYYVEFDESDSRFLFVPGRGFWVLSTEEVEISRQVETVPVNSRDNVTIDLAEGWNMISNPFTEDVLWQEVQQLNGFNAPLYRYDGSFNPANRLQPYEGYYVYNDPADPAESLDIPYMGLDGRGYHLDESSGEKGRADVETAPSFVRIEALFGEDAGQHHALVELDYTPRSGPGDVQYHPSLDFSRYGMMLRTEEEPARTGIRQKPAVYDSDGEAYNLLVKAPHGTPVSWRMSMQHMDDNVHLLLVNPENGRFYSAAADDEFEFLHSGETVEYELYIASEEAVEEIQNSLIPDQVILEPNYPNPFNPVTTIRYSLPADELVRIEVYDILGRRVQVLHDGPQQAGWHQFEFDGRQLASGTYIYRLIAGPVQKIGRMTLIK